MYEKVLVGILALALLHVGCVLKEAEPVRGDAPPHPEGVEGGGRGEVAGLGLAVPSAKVEGLVDQRFHTEQKNIG